MKKTRKNLPHELETLQNRLRELLRASMDERLRTARLLCEAERKIEDQFGQLDSLETVWEISAKKHRKKPAQDTVPLHLNQLTPNAELQTSNFE
jgi:hypothetical protein